MKKKLRALYILIAAAVLLGAGTFVLRLSPKSAEDEGSENADTPCTVTDFPVGTVSALAVTNSKCSIGLLVMGENVELVLADGAGKLAESGIDASRTELRSMVYMLCHIEGTRELPMPEDKASCGYASPNANMTFIFSDGSTREYLMGSEIPGDRGYYLFDLGENRLFIISGDTAALLLRSPQDFVSHSVFPTVPTSEYQTVSKIEFERNGEHFVIENIGGAFRFTSPIEQKIRAYNVYSSVIAPLGGIYADSCIAAGAELSEYGFDKPALDVSMCVAGKTYHALFHDNNGMLLMADASNGNIYTVDSDLLKLLPESMMSLLDGKPYYYSLGDCRNVRIEYDGRELDFEISGSGKGISASCGGKTLDADDVSALSQSLNGIEISERYEGNAAGDTVLTMYFTLNDGGCDTLRILDTDTALVCEVNGIVNFTVTPLSVSDLLAALTAYG